MIPVLNKIDLKVARPDVVMEQLKNIFEIDAEQVIKVWFTFLIDPRLRDFSPGRTQNQTAQPQKMATGMKYWTWKLERFLYLGSRK